MGIRVLGFIPAKQILPHSVLTTKNKEASTCADVPKGFLSVYVGENQKKRFLVPEFGFNYPMGASTIPSGQDTFIEVISRLDRS
ncbi:hypothetical protein CISIN_1g041106mg [Citrus sinensis]|uniref:Uncharacterized protein n=1 Tax=Citrus sinensis TaxID=2711 RepID=A0A067D473_CITSI|nr:hypothetical protein CISIN_1g041106mg [Citrus sinensis]